MFFFSFSHNEIAQYISHWSQKYTANKEKQPPPKKSHIGKKPLAEKSSSTLPRGWRATRWGLEASSVRWTEHVFSVSKLSSYSLDFTKTQPHQTRTFLTLLLKYRLKGKGKKGTEIQTTALNIYMDSAWMCLCARRFSQHVCTRLLTYTVYSWLGSEPGALKIV